jgi:hypothetical protein
MKLQTLVYDKHRRCILLYKKHSDSKYELPCISIEGYRDRHSDYSSNFKDLLSTFLERDFQIKTEYERPILFVYDEDFDEFVLTVTMKEIKRASEHGSGGCRYGYALKQVSEHEWFGLNNLPDFSVIEDMSKIALRAEMKEVTYDIPEYSRA